jgi:hypothetical protein
MIQTEYSFTLPIGYQDKDGTLHREGMMRLATAADEILRSRIRVSSRTGALVVILMSRVITALGGLAHVNPKVIEDLYAADLVPAGVLQPDQPQRTATSRPSVEVRRGIRGGDGHRGVLGYPFRRYEEVAFVAYYFHWPPESILGMPHGDRRRWVQEISTVNQRVNGGTRAFVMSRFQGRIRRRGIGATRRRTWSWLADTVRARYAVGRRRRRSPRRSLRSVRVCRCGIRIPGGSTSRSRRSGGAHRGVSQM